jgi:hypothetical protein
MFVLCVGCAGQVEEVAGGPGDAAPSDGSVADVAPDTPSHDAPSVFDASVADASADPTSDAALHTAADAAPDVDPDAAADAVSEAAPDAPLGFPDASRWCGDLACEPLGYTQCVGDVSVRTCILDADGCPAWGAPAPCPVGLTCAQYVSQSTSYIPPKCVPPTCEDGTQDEGETGVDCGGPCPACLDEACGADQDCVTYSCDALSDVCVQDQCVDHRQDGHETDVDCGGSDSCSRCLAGSRCVHNSDCLPGHLCEPTTHTCQ